MTAAGDEQESGAWASSASCGRAGGSIYATAVLNALVQTAEIHREGVDESEAMSCPTYINLCCAVHQAYKESDPFYGSHGVPFAARDDMWESEWRTRSGFPLLDYQKKWEELRQVSPGQPAFDSVPTLGFAGSIEKGFHNVVRAKARAYADSFPGADNLAPNLPLHSLFGPSVATRGPVFGE